MTEDGRMSDDLESLHSDEREAIREHNSSAMKPPSFTRQAVSQYLGSRFRTLFVPRSELEQYSWSDIYNPFQMLGMMNSRQWNAFFVGFWGWTLDAFDFFAVSLNTVNMAESFGVSVKDITWGITLVLMLRSVGAVIFGIVTDHWGRKWPYVINMALLICIQIGTGFVQTYKQFLGVRAIFGIAMGGVFGTCMATATDDCPTKARGIVGGMFQQGYALGNLLAVVMQRALVVNVSKGWRSIFWFSAGPGVLLIIWRILTPESIAFTKQKADLALITHSNGSRSTELKKSAKKALKIYWLIIIYCIFMMSGFNFMSHGSQDLYPTLLTSQLHFGADRSTVTNAVANLGAIFGGVTLGHLSTFVGRRLTVILACIFGGAMIYPWAYLRNSGINAGAFFLQVGVQGAWGVGVVHIFELSPPQFRAFVGGVAYQLGNLCSSASSTIEATIGERFPINEPGEEATYDYSKTMAIFIGCVFGYLILVIFIGPENRGASFDMRRDDVISEADLKLSGHDDDKKPEASHVESRIAS